jgi:hypothetical protein
LYLQWQIQRILKQYSEDKKQKPAFLHKPIKNILANLRKGTEEQENKESNIITLEDVSM